MAALASVNSLGCTWWQSNLVAHAIVSVVINTDLAELNRCIHGEIQRHLWKWYGSRPTEVLDKHRAMPEACLWLSQP